MSFIIAPVFFFSLAVALSICSVKLLFKSSWMSIWIKFPFIITLLPLAIFSLFFSYDLSRYDERTPDKTVAHISFEKMAEKHYKADLMLENGAREQFSVSGDQWVLSARFANFLPVFGFNIIDSGYQLDRLQGRYDSVSDEMNEARTVYDLRKYNGLIDTWNAIKKIDFLAFIRLDYGTAVYLPMEEGATYLIKVSDDGLYTVAENNAARDAIDRWKD